MDHRAVRTLMHTLVASFVACNCHRFNYRIYDDLPPVSPLGFHIDPQRFAGKVMALTDEAIVIKVKRTGKRIAVTTHKINSETPHKTRRETTTSCAPSA